MSKNTASNKFRKVDVDQYDEDKFQDEDSDITEDGQNHGDAAKETEVSNLLAQKKNVEALKLVLATSPVDLKNQAIKDWMAQLVQRVLTAFKGNDIEAALKTLDSATIDILMKYIYRGFENPSDNNSGVLLTWHEKTFAVGGLGSIVRVLTDRKKV